MPKQMIGSDVMLVFRQGTKDLHAQIESESLFANLMTDSVSLPDYGKALQGLHRFYSEIEPLLLNGIEKFMPEQPYIPRQYLLERDLAHLRFAINRVLPNLRKPLTSVAETLGVLYVVEGSTLGGQIISRHLRVKLGADVRDALAFYTLGGNLDATHWTQLKENFRKNLIDQSEIEEGINTARGIFLKMLTISKETREC